jgi:hypothetical protein
MSTGPETEVISCPACRHLLRVPLAWLGEQVQCPECRAMFRAPARDAAGGLTPAELISRPAPATAPPPRKRADAMLLLPAFGLLFCGVAGTIVNGVQAARYLGNPRAATDDVLNVTAELRRQNVLTDGPEQPGERAKFDEQRAAEYAPLLRVTAPAFTAVSALAFLGGLSMALRWNYRLAQVGCLAALLNLPNLCCVPGGVAGVWGLLMLGSEEGRAHFGR